MKHTHGITLAAMRAFAGMVFFWKRRPKPQ